MIESSESDDELRTPLLPDPRTPGSMGAMLRKAAVHEQLFGEPLDPVRIGRFAVERRLGSGGLGVVYEAHDPELDRSVAIKVLRVGADGVGGRGRRLRREAQAMARLSHANVVPVFEVGEHQGQTYLAMELVKGQTLKQWQASSPRSWREIVDVYLQAGRGLAAAHRAGLVHRDFKPDNAVVGNDGVVRVLDFGLVGNAEPPTRVSTPTLELDEPRRSYGTNTPPSSTRTGDVIGTPAYMSPEQMAGISTDARSDQFSFCVALWEALAGRRPFSGGTIGELAKSVRRGPPSARLESTPRRVEAVLRTGLEFDAADRHPDMATLLHALERGARPRRPRWTWAGAAVLLVVSGLGWRWLSGGSGGVLEVPPVIVSVVEPTATRVASTATDRDLSLARGRRLAGPTWRAFAIAGKGWVLATDGVSTWWEDADGSNRVSVGTDPPVTPLTPTGDGNEAVVTVPEGIAILGRELGIVRRFPTSMPIGRGHVAPGGHHLVFAQDDAVLTLDLQTGEIRRRFELAKVKLSSVAPSDWLPGTQVVWSPDGQWLAVQIRQFMGEEIRTRLVAIRPDGSEARELGTSGPGPSDPCLAWLARGIVFGERTWSAGSLFVLPLVEDERGLRAAGEPRSILHDESVQLTCYPTSDPETLIVASSPERASERQYIADIGQGGVLHDVRPLAGRSTSSPVAWLDQESYVVAARSGESRHLFRGSLRSTDLVPLRDDHGADALNVVAWGERGAVSKLFVWEEQTGHLDLVRRDLASGRSERVLDWGRSSGLASGRAPMLACTPGGRCVLATRQHARSLRIERFDPHDGQRGTAVDASLTGMVHWMELGALSPDASHFAAAVYAPRIEIVDLDSGAVRTLPYSGPRTHVRAQGATWSNRGDRLFVTGRAKDLNLIWAVDPRSGRWTEAYHASEDWFCSPRVAPSDEHLAFTVLDIRATLWIADLRQE